MPDKRLARTRAAYADLLTWSIQTGAVPTRMLSREEVEALYARTPQRVAPTSAAHLKQTE